MNKETQMMLVPQGSIEGLYSSNKRISDANTAEEEKRLAERLYYDGDIEQRKISFITLTFLLFMLRVVILVMDCHKQI